METVETVGDRTVHFRVILRLYPFGYSDENELSTVRDKASAMHQQKGVGKHYFRHCALGTLVNLG